MKAIGDVLALPFNKVGTKFVTFRTEFGKHEPPPTAPERQ